MAKRSLAFFLVSLSLLLSGCGSILSQIDLKSKSVSFVFDHNPVVEGQDVTLTASLGSAQQADLAIAIAVDAGSSDESTYFSNFPTQLLIPAGQTSASVVIHSVPDGVYEATRIFNLSFSILDTSVSLKQAKITLRQTDNTAPPLAPTLAVSDALTSSTQYLHATASAKISIGGTGNIARWCITETNQAPTSSTDPCVDGKGPSLGWFVTSPDGVQVSVTSGDGLKTLYLWGADASGNLSPAASTTITLDSAIPTAPTIQISDSVTSSTTYTNQSPADLSLGAVAGAVKWCVIETSASAAAPATPAFDSTCFQNSAPTSWSFAAEGSRRLYVYTQSRSGNVSTSPNSADILYTSLTVQWSQTAVSVKEDAGTATLTVNLSKAAPSAFTIPYTVSGTASFAHHDLVDGSISVASGATSATLTFNLTNDSTDNGSRTVIVTLEPPTLATLGTNTVQTVTIIDDDLEFIMNNTFTNAGSNIVFLVTQSSVSDSATTFSYSTNTSGTAVNGVDYTARSGTGTIPAGQTSTTISVPTSFNLTNYFSKTVGINVTSVASSTRNTHSPSLSATGFIVDSTIIMDFMTGSLPSGVSFRRNSEGTYFDASGVMRLAAVNEPRFDYDPVTHELKGLLIENNGSQAIGAREYFRDFSWIKNGLTVANTSEVLSLMETDKAEILTESAANEVHSIEMPNLLVSNTDQAMVFSVFVRSRTSSPRNFIRLSIEDANNSTNYVTAVFNLTPGGETVETHYAGGYATNSSAYIQNMGNGGWYRIAVAGRVTAGNFVTPRIVMKDSANFVDPYLGDGSKSIYVWGANLVTNESYPSSFIPEVLGYRDSDFATTTDVYSYNPAASTMIVNFRQDFPESNWYQNYRRIWDFGFASDPWNDNCFLFFSSQYSLFQVTTKNAAGDPNWASFTPNYNPFGVLQRMATMISAEGTVVNTLVNGGSQVTGVGSLSRQPDTLSFLNGMSGYSGYGGHIQSFTYRPRALTEGEAALMTAP